MSATAMMEAIEATPATLTATREGLQREVRIRRPDDFHCHFRQGELLERVAPLHSPYFGRVLAMPNTKPEVETGEQAALYRMSLALALGAHCTPLSTIMLTDDTSPSTIRNARLHGVTAAKLYPKGATNNSGKGVSDVRSARMQAVLGTMQGLDMVLCGHFEDPLGEISDRERDYIRVVDKVARDYPRLRIVVEHVTTAEMAAWVAGSRDGVAGTITAHHLVCTENDVLGIQGLPDYDLPNEGPSLADGLTSPACRPHYYCLPTPKKMRDRRALIGLAVSGLYKFFLGTDSAPHEVGMKECAYGCAGVFVPGKVALATLAWVFETCGNADWPKYLEQFASENGARFYGLPLNEGTITLRRQAWTVPGCMADVVPFAADHALPWEPFPDAE